MKISRSSWNQTSGIIDLMGGNLSAVCKIRSPVKKKHSTKIESLRHTSGGLKTNVVLLCSKIAKSMGGGSSDSKGGEKNRCLSRTCGYEYMTPGYIMDDETASYPDIANALLENSSAHGLPTFYRAQGDSQTTVITHMHT